MSITLPKGIKLPQEGLLSKLLGGMGTGMEKGSAEALKNMLTQRAKQQQLKQTLGLYQQLSGEAPMGQQPVDGMQEGQQMPAAAETGEISIPSAKAVATMSAVNSALGRAMGEERKEGMRAKREEKKLTQQQRLAYIKINEPLIKTLQDRSTSLDKSGAEFDKLNEIFTVHADKLPSSFTAAMFNLDGESGLSRFGRAKLSPEAQEVTKLITNQIRGLRDLFPGRILKEEIKLFMKTLPGFLNTKEGKIKILRDLRIMNKIGRLETSSTLEEFRKAGGSGNILHSEAVRRGKQAAEPQIKALRQMFVNSQEQTGESQFTVGQTFEGLPATAPEGAIMSKGNQTFIFRNGRWSKR